jgi:CCR4-NOT transcription complex subunit 2
VSKDPYHLPESFSITSLSPPANVLPLLTDDSLLYAFYSSPKDVLQLNCSRELFKRGWRYHKELQRWLLKIAGSDMRVTTNAYDSGPYFVYDPSTFEKVRNDNVTVVFDKLEQEK